MGPKHSISAMVGSQWVPVAPFGAPRTLSVGNCDREIDRGTIGCAGVIGKEEDEVCEGMRWIFWDVIWWVGLSIEWPGPGITWSSFS